MPLYFPRSLEEEIQSLPYLPADIGNAEGEPVVPERQIRITEKPGVPDGEFLTEFWNKVCVWKSGKKRKKCIASRDVFPYHIIKL